MPTQASGPVGRPAQGASTPQASLLRRRHSHRSRSGPLPVRPPFPLPLPHSHSRSPIPDKLGSDALTGADSTIVRGDLLCTVTSKGNLAMVKIVGVEASTSKQYDIPTYLTEVTLWKPQS
ncbi:hypothetical protein [Streptomyces sp. NBC_00347]|uniref:hypothetical protein n=1 Tax=Streptomyces sp. NBC_00347 TaxID=2975721 RepID=UPI0022501B70|nr:hypothetical protein [Streptomyces sp. NBC_00347]MCX5123775.1 hypothetical protein [Streptomyces sp. NBC_00347]